jgi:hypothetical protein
MSFSRCCNAVTACGAAATLAEDLIAGLSDAHPCRDLAIPFNDIDARQTVATFPVFSTG